VLACFSDPGLHAVREAAGGRPVLGIAECGIFRALMLGERFGIIALSPSSIRRQQRMARVMGVDSRYGGSWSEGLALSRRTTPRKHPSRGS
jgi:Asp/Glu/hydantoin racemase